MPGRHSTYYLWILTRSTSLIQTFRSGYKFDNPMLVVCANYIYDPRPAFIERSLYGSDKPLLRVYIKPPRKYTLDSEFTSQRSTLNV